jgi:hypothetical protein
MATLLSTNFSTYSGNLQANATWVAFANDATCDGVNADIGGSGERLYQDGVTPGTADGYVQAVVDSAGNGNGGVACRIVDASNWYWGYYSKVTGDWSVDQNNSGSITNLSAFTQGGRPNSMTLKLTVSTGQALELFGDGVSKVSTTGSRSGTSGQYGFRCTSMGGGSYDDYISEDTAGGGGTTRGTPFGHRGTAFNGGRTFHGIIQ